MADSGTASGDTSSFALRYAGAKNLSTIGENLACQIAKAVDARKLPANGLHFRCPAKSCLRDFHHDCSYETFVSHVSEHESELFSVGLNVCPFGCESGFLDPVQQHPNMSAPDAYDEGPQVCNYRGCPSVYSTPTSMSWHFLYEHGDDVYEDMRYCP
jgi:hypothetical protein